MSRAKVSKLSPDRVVLPNGNCRTLEWVIDPDQVSTDQRSGIFNDPNCPDEPEYIVGLPSQVINVSWRRCRW